ncbi:hypothetical protein [Stutzerimonas balearica]|uniref:Uncharacterized protein n=1 Tax=Stutzerimonas balearica DSM 6083 TaxID=1123016 RepID=A0A8D4C0V4_9GAMM|nr:hypothetical protein [Stutzerimonas balearica]AJE13615.1 hypothetical protein CL52_00590 [Stutzerimonas balearica DSM 6083]SDL92540.1 hypothetical protein SAMN05660875_101120 [Stutzerimonas balearica DSM 6083]
MNLFELASRYPQRAEGGVPEWMLGHFRRRTISFADGRSDQRTRVHWLQSRTFTIDLRLPNGPALPVRPLADYSAEERRVLANHEGWVADSVWAEGRLSWEGGVALQLHNRWPEPALLQRVGNCMIEFAPSGAYVEDWRLQATGGPLLGLRLIDERDAQSGELLHQGGGLIVCGAHAGWVHGRPEALPDSPLGLRERAGQADATALAALFDFETSLAVGDAQAGYRVELSTVPARVGQALVLDGFERLADGRLRQCLETPEGRAVVRLFEVDTLEPEWRPVLATPSSAEAQGWFEAEAETLGRYLEVLE